MLRFTYLYKEALECGVLSKQEAGNCDVDNKKFKTNKHGWRMLHRTDDLYVPMNPISAASPDKQQACKQVNKAVEKQLILG